VIHLRHAAIKNSWPPSLSGRMFRLELLVLRALAASPRENASDLVYPTNSGPKI
jgi:hypothetical protein